MSNEIKSIMAELDNGFIRLKSGQDWAGLQALRDYINELRTSIDELKTERRELLAVVEVAEQITAPFQADYPDERLAVHTYRRARLEDALDTLHTAIQTHHERTEK